jgi:hypothetical protein
MCRKSESSIEITVKGETIGENGRPGEGEDPAHQESEKLKVKSEQ